MSKITREQNLSLHKAMYVISAIIMLCFLLTFSWMGYMLYVDDTPPAKINNLPMPVEISIFQDSVKVTVDICWYTDAQATIYPNYVNGVIFSGRPGIVEIHKKGECSVHTRVFQIPEELPDGTYHMEGKTIYQVNPLVTRELEWTTQEFTLTRGRKTLMGD